LIEQDHLFSCQTLLDFEWQKDKNGLLMHHLNLKESLMIHFYG